MSLHIGNVKHCPILNLQILHHARCASFLEELLTKQKQHNGYVLASCKGWMHLSYTIGTKEIIVWSLHERFGNSVHAIHCLKHHWSKTSFSAISRCLMRSWAMFRRHAKVMFTLRSVKITVKNQTDITNRKRHYQLLWFNLPGS